ncbi:MAG: type VII toxin-antitoxin system HepT family RNase toxin [Promethearchaeota archaeon]
MDELRKKRYRDKINYIVDCLKVLPVKPKNELEKRGIFYSLQTSIEAVIDLIAMVIKDLGIPVKDDESNISELVKKRNINQELGVDLKKANGMRNIIVHRYNDIEEEIILNSVEDVKNLLMKWLDIIEEVLEGLTIS